MPNAPHADLNTIATIPARTEAAPSATATDDTKTLAAKKGSRTLPTRYFHLVFTLPLELREIVRSNQKTLYAILMQAEREAGDVQDSA